jgi:hypothetical protein
LKLALLKLMQNGILLFRIKFGKAPLGESLLTIIIQVANRSAIKLRQ